MANHAYVIPETMPAADEILAAVRETLARKFPMLVLEWEPHNRERNLAIVSRPDLSGFGLCFWLDRFETGPDDEGRPCIEFRHGHAWGILWWIEQEIREDLAARYKAVQYDDAQVEPTPNRPERFDTYSAYQVWNRRFLTAGRDPLLRAACLITINRELADHRAELPADLQCLIGDDVA